MRPVFRCLLVALWCLCLGAIVPLAAQAQSQAEARATLYAALMQRGMTALKTQDAPKAATYFSKALQLAPRDVRTQILLAESYIQAGQTGRAEAFLTYLLDDPRQVDHADLYLGALNKLYEKRPLVASGSFALMPGTNIKNASSQTYFDTLLGRLTIDDGGDEMSGIGVDVGGRAAYRVALGAGRRLEFGGSLTHVWYEEKSLRYWYGRLWSDLVHLSPGAQWRGGAHISRLYHKDEEGRGSDRVAKGLHANWSQDLGEGMQVGVSAIAEYRDYLASNSFSGPYASVGVHWSKRTDRSEILSVGVTVERATREVDYHSYWGGSLRGGYERPFGDNLRAGVGVSATLRVYDAEFFTVDYARRDEIYRVDLSVSDKRLKMMGATPKLTCGYRVQSSNVALYDSNSTDCRVSWSYQF